jgi:hypothetical protein
MTVTIPSSNWKTTIAGLVGAILTVITQFSQNGNKLDWHQLPLPVTLAILGFFAKDFNTTGGTVANSSNDPAVVVATTVAKRAVEPVTPKP